MEGEEIQQQHTTHENSNSQQLVAEEQHHCCLLGRYEKRNSVNQYGNCADEEHRHPEPTESAAVSRSGQFSEQIAR